VVRQARLILRFLFCPSNITVAVGLLHQIHLGDAQTVGKFLGGNNFTSCATLASTITTAATKTATATPAVFTGAVVRTALEGGVVLGCVCGCIVVVNAALRADFVRQWKSQYLV
jgi:hypothetical protein